MNNVICFAAKVFQKEILLTQSIVLSLQKQTTFYYGLYQK